MYQHWNSIIEKMSNITNHRNNCKACTNTGIAFLKRCQTLPITEIIVKHVPTLE
jgi:hypothetical protein